MSCHRYPVNVKAVGFMQCRKQKNYMMFVSWSDQNNILIYRTFEDFKKFHKELKRKFPTERGSLRSLPRFKGITVQHRKGGKLNRGLEIMKLLETYSQELLKMDVKISRGEEVNQFFKAQTQDLDPSFPENSVVIMPSVFRREKSPQPLSITLPQASQSYRCIEAFETKDTKNKPFTVAQKEIVEVLIKDMSGWWLVENADKQIAWFPASYLEELDACEDVQTALSQNEEGSLFFVVQAYEAQKEDELSLNQGVVVEVLRKSHHGWWLVRYNGCTGYMPSMCLRPYLNPHHRLQSILSCGLNASTPNLCSPELNRCSPEPNLCSPEPNLCSPEPNLCSPEPNLCSPQPNLCSPEPNLCSPEPNLCSPEPNLCSPQPNLCSPEPNLCSPEPNLCSPEPNLCSPQPNLCSPEPNLCSPEPNLCSPQPNLRSPQPQAGPRPQPSPECLSSSHRSRSCSLPRASSTPQLDLDLDSSSLSSGSSGDWKPDLSRSLPEVEQARSTPGLVSHLSKSPQLSARHSNDSGFVESSPAELSSSLAEPEVATGVPKVPARPSAQEILQRCSTVTKRALQQSARRPGLLVPSRD